MGVWRTIGHERALRTLQRGLAEGRVSHAYLLAGPRHVGKMTLALDVARMVNCLADDRPCGECVQCGRVEAGLHSDVRVLGLDAGGPAEGRTRVAIGIDQVREVQREASLKPFEGAYRVFILNGAELLSEEAANSLLKILEEPPEQVVLLLLTSDAGGLLPTIVSRCQQLELRPLPETLLAGELESRYSVDGDRAREIARLSGGRLGWAFRAVDEPDLLDKRDRRLEAIEGAIRGDLEQRFSYAADFALSFARLRDTAYQELTLWLEWWRDALMIKGGVPELSANLSRRDLIRAATDRLSLQEIAGVMEAIRQTADRLERNVSPRLAAEELMLALPSA